MTHGLPKGVREDELSSFTSEHPRGVKVEFSRVEQNAWEVTDINYKSNLSEMMLLRLVDSLISDVERHGDAVVV